MKSYELTISESGVCIRHTNPNPLSAEQKYNLIQALIVAAAILGFFGLIGFMAAR